MEELFPWFLFTHVLGAIVAFGPSFSLPIIGAMGGREPMHANFATRVSKALSQKQFLPLAIIQGVTGVGLIVTGNVDLGKATWLQAGILLWAIAIGYAMAVQTPAVRRVVEMSSTPPPAGAPAGPPPEMRALISKIQRGGMLLIGLIVTIVFLMVVKPTF